MFPLRNPDNMSLLCSKKIVLCSNCRFFWNSFSFKKYIDIRKVKYKLKRFEYKKERWKFYFSMRKMWFFFFLNQHIKFQVRKISYNFNNFYTIIVFKLKRECLKLHILYIYIYIYIYIYTCTLKKSTATEILTKYDEKFEFLRMLKN